MSEGHARAAFSKQSVHYNARGHRMERHALTMSALRHSVKHLPRCRNLMHQFHCWSWDCFFIRPRDSRQGHNPATPVQSVRAPIRDCDEVWAAFVLRLGPVSVQRSLPKGRTSLGQDGQAWVCSPERRSGPRLSGWSREMSLRHRWRKRWRIASNGAVSSFSVSSGRPDPGRPSRGPQTGHKTVMTEHSGRH